MLSRFTLGALLAAAPVCAEFLHIELGFGGMECASCSRAIVSGLKRLRGVASVEMKENAVQITLAKGNRVRLETVRDVVKGTGFTPGAARVQVRGRVRSGGFEVDGLSQTLRVVSGSKLTESANLVVDGTIPAPATPASQNELEVRSARAGVE